MTGSLQVKRGKYYIVLNLYEDGERRKKWIATGLPERGNKRQAQQLLNDALHEYEYKQVEPEPNYAETTLFTDYLQHWMEIANSRVDEVTFQGYKLLTERHIIPYFKQRRVMLSEVNRRMLQSYLNQKSRNGRLDGKGGLSPKSVRELKNLLHQQLNEAVREELIDVNPCTLLVLPKSDPPSAKFYSVKQLNDLLEAVRDEPLYPVIKTAVIYGLRRSELLGIKWDSIDFETDTLTIRHTVVKVTKTVEKDKTKSKSSHRSFPLIPEIREMFLDIQKEKQRNAKLMGRAYVKSDYVFCWPDGRPFSPDYVTQKFPKLLKQHGFPHIRFHELRHSCASLLINQGYTLKDVQEWMGHSDIGVTANIYGHLETKRKEEMASRMSSCING
ncbi:MAG: tyrosine-type recombinase/integrase [Oscillospiraceae bacterium]|nr:tyrosine-type recombinase/integrase [Oscillospiraceae bacterium]